MKSRWLFSFSEKSDQIRGLSFDHLGRLSIDNNTSFNMRVTLVHWKTDTGVRTGISFVAPNLKFVFLINALTRAKIRCPTCLSVTVVGGKIMDTRMTGRTKLQIKSSNQDLINFIHSDISVVVYHMIDGGEYATESAAQLAAAAQSTLGWAGGQDMDQLGVILKQALERLFTECGTDDAADRSKALATKYAQILTVVRVETRFKETFVQDEKLSECFEKQGRKITTAYTTQNENNNNKFRLRSDAKKQDYLFAILNSFAFERGMTLV